MPNPIAFRPSTIVRYRVVTVALSPQALTSSSVYTGGLWDTLHYVINRVSVFDADKD